ncbi:hypothetical protein LEP1GSC059_0758 [Leptospira noguchii serovar Panama str. CZ214]|uniref:Integrase core domain protein n=1 Tax=Leptospira noguchii serovar Panama str. CZ214 TaxID=1001595 RepID=T0FQG8_9LEPT|nr:hypothetical protein LEP1GSC059_0758 [Leptospira noguchii serovar Panama str. CZ214]
MVLQKREIEYNYFYRFQEAKQILFDQVDVYYNKQRSSLIL